MPFNYKSIHKYYIIIPLLDKNGFYLEAHRVISRAVALLKVLASLSVSSLLLFWTLSFQFLLQRDAVTVLLQSTHSEQQSGVADSSQGRFEEGVDVSRLVVYIKSTEAGAPITMTFQTKEPQRMAGDQLTHGDAVRAGRASVAELSSVLWEMCRPGVQHTWVSVSRQVVVLKPVETC